MRYLLIWRWGSHREESEIADVTWQVSADLTATSAPVRRVSLELHPRDIEPAAYALTADGSGPGIGYLYRIDVDPVDGTETSRLVAAGRWRSVRCARGVVAFDLADEAPGMLDGVPTLGDDRQLWPGPATIETRETLRGGAELFFDARPEGDLIAARNEPIDPGKRTQTNVFVVTFAKYQEIWGPIVWGAPGSLTRPGSPAYLISEALVSGYWHVRVAGHRVTAGSCRLWATPWADQSGVPTLAGHGSDGNGLYTIYEGTDDDGAIYSYIKIPDVDTDPATNPDFEGVVPTNNDEMFVSWTEGDALPGGAGDLLAYLLERSAMRVDLAAWQAAAGALNRFELAGYIDRQVYPADLARQIMEALPVAMAHSIGGIVPLLHPLAEDWPDGEPLVVETDGEITIPDSVPMHLVVEYAHGPGSEEPGATLQLGPEDTPILAAAQSIGALGETQRLVLPHVWSASAARLIGETWLRCRMPGPTIAYSLDPSLYGPGGARELTAGQVVRLTSDGLGLNGRLAYVSDIEATADRLRATLMLSPDLLGAR